MTQEPPDSTQAITGYGDGEVQPELHSIVKKTDHASDRLEKLIERISELPREIQEAVEIMIDAIPSEKIPDQSSHQESLARHLS